MASHLITENAAFIRLLLDNACPADVDRGISTFAIETCDVLWYIEAYKPDGEWRILSMRSQPA